MLGGGMASFDWQRVQADFPVNQRLIWLNNCGTTPPPRAVLSALERHHQAYAERGILGVVDLEALHDSVRGRLARMLEVAADELCLVHHTTEAMTFVSHGLRLRAGDEILLLEHEYPSNVYPWEHWRQKGVRLTTLPLAPTPEQLLETFHGALTAATRVVSVSAVHWCTGMPLPLEPMAAACEARGIELVVDAAQGAGLLPLDLGRLRIGYMGFSAWKWLLGPLGLGVLYVRRDKLPKLSFPFKGTGSVVDDHVYLPYRDELKAGTDRYVLSTPNVNDWIYFDASLEYLENIGFERVRHRIIELAGRLVAALRERGFIIAHDDFSRHPTGIVAVHKPGLNSDAVVARLAEAGVVAASRLGRVRLAPHVYLSEAQIDAAVERLTALC